MSGSAVQGQSGGGSAGAGEAGSGGAGSGGGARTWTNPFEAGPLVRLSTGALLAAAWGASASVGFVVWGVAKGVGSGGAKSAWLGVGVVWAAFLAGTLAMRPWRPRRLGAMPAAWLLGRGACLLGVAVAAPLVYFLPPSRPDALVMGLALGSAYFAAVIAESVVMTRRLRGATGTTPPSLG